MEEGKIPKLNFGNPKIPEIISIEELGKSLFNDSFENAKRLQEQNQKFQIEKSVNESILIEKILADYDKNKKQASDNIKISKIILVFTIIGVCIAALSLWIILKGR